ncbi:MAG: Zn-dependent alcohol dehydrogenase [Chloroflexota bacterium]
MKIQAAVLYGVNEPLKVETLDLALPQPGEVLVKMGAAGVCHSDYHVITGDASQVLPCVLGHEGAGEVVDVGEGVTKVKVSDHVILNWLPHCNSCYYCQHNQTNLCTAYHPPVWAGTMMDGTVRLTNKAGEPVRHLSAIATWANYAVVHEDFCVIIRDEVPFDVASLIGCGVTTGVGAAINKAQVTPGSTVAVFGAGGVGLSIIMGARLAGAGRIIAVDIAEAKGDIAQQFGATDFVMGGPHAINEIRNLTEGRGADYVFEAVGNAALQAACFEATRPGGTVCFVGMTKGGTTVSLDAPILIRQEKTVVGSFYGSAHNPRDFVKFGDLFLQGKLPLNELIFKHYPLEKINEANDVMLTGETGRGVLVFD